MSKDSPRRLRGHQIDAGIAQSTEQALKSLPAVKERFLKGLPTGFKFYVTIGLSNGLGNTENAYIAVNRWESNEIFGTLATELNTVRAHALGEALRFPDSRIIDWTITAPDGSEEGNLIGKFFDSLLYCKTEGCHATPLSFTASVARAHLEATLLTAPAATFKLDCSDCSKTSSYTMRELIELIPANLRPRDCPAGEFWGFVLIEIPAADKNSDRTFLGEALYCYMIQESATEWQAKCLSSSRFLKSLGNADLLLGTKNGRFNVVTGVMHNGKRIEVPLVPGVPQNSEFAVFAIGKNDPGHQLRTGTLFCSNPICFYPFRLTHSEWIRNCEAALKNSPVDGASLESSVSCPKCGTTRIVNENSFRGMVLI